MVKLTLSPDIATVRNLLGLIQKALTDKPTDGSVVGNLLNMINMWVSVPAVLENQEALDHIFQYRTIVIKNWVYVSTNRSLLDQLSSIINFRALVKLLLMLNRPLKSSKNSESIRSVRPLRNFWYVYFSVYAELAVN